MHLKQKGAWLMICSPRKKIKLRDYLARATCPFLCSKQRLHSDRLPIQRYTAATFFADQVQQKPQLELIEQVDALIPL